MKLVIYTDGGSRGNPGPAALAFIIKDEAGKNQEKCGKYLGVATNNVAEYQAALEALTFLHKEKKSYSNLSEILFRLDSELVVRQLNGSYRVKDPDLKRIWQQIFVLRRLLEEEISGLKISFSHIPREENTEADRLVNDTLDQV